MKKRESDARERIVQAASDLIVEQGGADSLTMRDIAARANVGVGLANYHFQTKENLVGLCAQRFDDGLMARLGGLYASLDMEPPAKLKMLAREYMQCQAEHPGMARASALNGLCAPAAGDGAARAMDAFLPAIREACAGRATETEIMLLDHLLISSLQAAFLRGKGFGEFTGINALDAKQGGQLADVTVYILFHKYL